MRPRGPWNRSLKIIERLYIQFACVYYGQFIERWYLGRPPRRGIPSPPSQQTFSRIWTEYRNQTHLRKLDGEPLVQWLLDQYAQGDLNLGIGPPELERRVTELLVAHKIVKPASYRFRRCLRSAVRSTQEEESASRLTHLENSLNISIRTLPLVRRWTNAQELLRHPPAQIGRASIPKMAEEYRIYRELSTALEKNGLEPDKLLSNPDCERHFRFVERRSPSTLSRWEQGKILEALPFYLAGRLRDSIDSILICFVRKARLLRSRITEEVEEDRREESLALLERSGADLRDLQIAISEALAVGTPKPLLPFQKRLTRLRRDGAATLDRDRLYRMIGSRGTYTRKLARRLVGLHFAGHDPHSEALVEVLPEVFRFARFDEGIPLHIIRKLAFLQVSQNLLANRLVFEPVVLITLADYLWSGRMTASLSSRFSDILAVIPQSRTPVDPQKWTSDRRRKLDKAWTEFERAARSQPLVEDGRLQIRRPPRRQTERAESRQRERHMEFIARCRTASIVEILSKVHRSTGFLNEFKLERPAPHELVKEERLRTTLGVLVSLGMNLGVREAAAVLGDGRSVGRIQTFLYNHFTKENLEAAQARLIRCWDKRGMGKQWGTGKTVSVDGRVIGAYQNNLLSRYHYRKGRTGMTVYWFRRDDGIATRVRPLGNQEWESWHVLDELLHPLAGQELRSSCGDTQGQFLALWGLAEILEKEILTRFRRPSRVLLFKPKWKNRGGLKHLRTIRWDIIERGLPNIFRLAEAVKTGRVRAVDVLRRWHLYDEEGRDIAEALRELGKVGRTEFLLRYARDDELQYRIRRACNDAEAWNSFHEAIFWGNGGRLRSNNPRRQDLIS